MRKGERRKRERSEADILHNKPSPFCLESRSAASQISAYVGACDGRFVVGDGESQARDYRGA